MLAPPGQSSEPIVAVLVTGAAGEYRIATVSKPVAPGCDTCTTTIDIATATCMAAALLISNPERRDRSASYLSALSSPESRGR